MYGTKRNGNKKQALFRKLQANFPNLKVKKTLRALI